MASSALLAAPARFEPTASPERLAALDIVRGFAVLGILLMNIIDMGLPHIAYHRIGPVGGESGANFWAWLISAIFIEGKMRTIFSMMFGAGVILLTSRAEARAATDTADIYYRRNLWLLFFALIHSYFIWDGDILYPYAITALLFLYPLRRLRAKSLIILGLVLVGLSLGRSYMGAVHVQQMRARAETAGAMQARGESLTERQQQDITDWEKRRSHLGPTQQEIEQQVATKSGGYGAVFRARVPEVLESHTEGYYTFWLFDIPAVMVLGMGLFKLGFFSAVWSMRRYLVVVAAGYVLGMSLNTYIALRDLQSGFDPVGMEFSRIGYDAGRLLVGLAHVALLLVTVKAGFLRFLTDRLRYAGQMALTNYLFASLAATTVFYGYGLGLYGKLQRYELYYVVAAIWLVQLVASKLWLTHFRFGPAEWAWRSLTYWRRQPMLQETAP